MNKFEKRGKFYFVLMIYLAIMACVVFMCSKVEAGILIHDIDTVNEYCGKAWFDHPSPFKTFHYSQIMDDLVVEMNKSAQRQLIKRLKEIKKLYPKQWAGIDPAIVVRELKGLVWRYDETLYLTEIGTLLEYDIPKLLKSSCTGEIIRKMFKYIVTIEANTMTQRKIPIE